MSNEIPNLFCGKEGHPNIGCVRIWPKQLFLGRIVGDLLGRWIIPERKPKAWLAWNVLILWCISVQLGSLKVRQFCLARSD